MLLFDTYRILSVAAITSIVLLLPGCGGSDYSPDLTIPSGSVSFHSGNAMAIAKAVLISRNNLGLVTRDYPGIITAKESESQFSARDAIDLVIKQVFNNASDTISVVSGLTLSSLCNSGGTFTTDANGTTTIKTGTITFSECNYNNLMMINGIITFHLRILDSTVKFNGFGTLSFTDLVRSTSFSIVVDFDETLDPNTGDFKRSEDFSVIDYPGLGSFLVETTKQFEGNYLSGLLDTGKLLITGGNNTLILISVNVNLASIKLDDGSGDGFVEIAGSPIYIGP